MNTTTGHAPGLGIETPLNGKVDITMGNTDKRQARIGLILTEDAVSLETPKLMGRQSAGNGFLRACLAHDNLRERITLITPSAKASEAVRKVVQQCLPLYAKDTVFPERSLHRPDTWDSLDVIHMPAPIASQQIIQRAVHRLPGLSLTGVTHTISSAHVVQQLSAYVREATQTRDALICTSQSVKTAVERLWHVEQAVLQRRFGRFEKIPDLPQLPVIPLGIHTRDFEFTAMDRLAARTSLGFSPEDLVVLFVGRLSFHAKANPLAMYRAVSQAANRTGQRIRIVECGWFANEHTGKAFDEAANHFGISVHRIDGRQAPNVQRSFAAADVFCSLSDNIQETFGLTPIEAMAAGLPCIVSDWNGYRETIIHGEHGFLIPTHMPGRAGLQGLEHRFANETLNYDHYIVHVHALTSVDIELTAQALTTLIHHPDLRKKMGAAARAHARQHWDWQHVIARYDDLWQAQFEQKSTPSQHRLPRTHSSRLSPADLFRHYPTQQIHADTPLYRQDWPGLYKAKTYASQAQDIRQWAMWDFLTPHWIPSAPQISQAVETLQSDRPRSIVQWGQSLQMSAPQSLRLASWLLKIGHARTQPATRSSPMHNIHLICTETQAQRTDIQRLFSDERWVLHPAETAKDIPTVLKNIAATGGHVMLLGPQAQVHDFWLAERLHDAWGSLAMINLAPHGLAIRNDLFTQLVLTENATWDPDMTVMAKHIAHTAQAHGMATGPWDIAINGTPVPQT